MFAEWLRMVVILAQSRRVQQFYEWLYIMSPELLLVPFTLGYGPGRYLCWASSTGKISRWCAIHVLEACGLPEHPASVSSRLNWLPLSSPYR